MTARAGGAAPLLGRADAPARAPARSVADEVALLGAGRELARAVVEGRADEPHVRARAETLAHAQDADPAAVSLSLLAHASLAPELHRHEPGRACAALLELLRALGGLERVSLWTSELGAVRCRAWLGASRPGPLARSAARRLLDPSSAAPTRVDDETVTVPIVRAGATVAAVVAKPAGGEVALAEAFVSVAAAALERVLERDALLAQGAETEQTLVAAHERRLTRLGFDLHDGPLQDVAVLSGELRTARRHAERELEPPVRTRVVGVFDDLIALVSELNGGLRAMARWLEGASVLRRPLAEVVEREVEQLQARTDIRVEVRASGDLEGLTDSQKITLFRVVQEALTNVREHSGAGSVQVSLSATAAWTTLEIVDDGDGFDPETTLEAAADRGRLGLLGAAERVRLLGGALAIDSAPGRGTRISASVPRWEARRDAEPVPA